MSKADLDVQYGEAMDEVLERLKDWAFTDELITRLRNPVHGDSSGVRGAAWLWDAP